MGVDGAGDRGERRVSALADWDMLSSSIRRIMGGMSVTGGHGVPEGLPCCRESGRGQLPEGGQSMIVDLRIRHIGRRGKHLRSGQIESSGQGAAGSIEQR